MNDECDMKITEDKSDHRYKTQISITHNDTDY